MQAHPPEPLSALEIAAGMVLEDPGARPASRPPWRPPPRVVLEERLLAGMQHGRASVSFSGGRDSSLVLAVATHVARREGLALPVPVTMRHDSAASQESQWQEEVVSHLGLSDWERIELGDSMDVVGPGATTVLTTFGVQAPPNAYLHLPLGRVAPHGTLFTGAGGDELFGTRAWRLASLLRGRERPRPSDVGRAAFAVAPRRVRRSIAKRRSPLAPFSWLRSSAWEEVRDRLAAEEVRTRLRWDVLAVTFTGSRALRMETAALDEVASLAGVAIASPLLAPDFISAFARDVGLAGPTSRSDAMRRLGSDVLPAALLTRGSKATFGGIVWGPEFRRFVEAWEPDTLHPGVRRLLDMDALLEEWCREEPHYNTMMLAQRAWVDQRRQSGR